MNAAWSEGMEILKDISLSMPAFRESALSIEDSASPSPALSPQEQPPSQHTPKQPTGLVSQQKEWPRRFSLPKDEIAADSSSEAAEEFDRAPETEPEPVGRVKNAIKQALMDECHADYNVLVEELLKLKAENEALTIRIEGYREVYGNLLPQAGSKEDDLAARLHRGERVCLCHIRGLTAARDLLITVSRLGAGPGLPYVIMHVRRTLDRPLFEKLMREDVEWVRVANLVLSASNEPPIPTGDPDLDCIALIERQVRLGFDRGDLGSRLAQCGSIAGQCDMLKGSVKSFDQWKTALALSRDIFKHEGASIVSDHITAVRLVEHVALRHTIVPDPKWPGQLSANTLRTRLDLSEEAWIWLWIRSCARVGQWSQIFSCFKKGRGGRAKDALKSSIDRAHAVNYLIKVGAPDATVRVFLDMLSEENRVNIMTQVIPMASRPFLSYQTIQSISPANKDVAIECFKDGLRRVRTKARGDEKYKSALGEFERLLATQPLGSG
ncbi:hypothetical protein J8273_3489 [Carpediemonas membranifera]|uniref:Uncharacterized protein n=1 Tax=Carpediemonas membranifera TaxID=201153 RepID=A0A8J6DZA2_9EUKA|nr:hypothetical protein J8273_3489 [Carpediemonas membranifera]|eukprot:KAG9393354.1 hypothetical protein J8273_3489 [Carpediemonas membranifera]